MLPGQDQLDRSYRMPAWRRPAGRWRTPRRPVRRTGRWTRYRLRRLLGLPPTWWLLVGLAGLALVRDPERAAGTAPERAEPRPSATSDTLRGEVVGVADGDSLYLAGVRPQLRLWNLDAPEYDARGGEAATQALTRLALGRELRCTIKDHDVYGRLVTSCRLPDGRDLTTAMVGTGTARYRE